MNPLLPILLMIIFSLLGLIHIYWAFGGQTGWLAALPEVNGKPSFRPSALMTYFVAFGLFLCALLISITAGFVTLPLPFFIFKWLTFALSLVLLLRATGDFNLVGFFKRVRGTRFAYLDTRFYSPLCFLLAIGVFLVAYGV